jgi:WD40 repeat protein
MSSVRSPPIQTENKFAIPDPPFLALDGRSALPPKNSNFSLITLNGCGHMKLWSTKKASLTRDFGERKNTTTEVMKILPNNKDLFINGKDNHLYQYNISNGNLIRDLGQAHKYWISAIESTPDSKYLFTGSFSSLKQWDCTTGALVKDYGSVHNTYIQCMAMTHDGKFLFTGGKSGMIKVIDVDAQTAREFRLDIATPGKPLLPFLLVLRFVVMSGR